MKVLIELDQIYSVEMVNYTIDESVIANESKHGITDIIGASGIVTTLIVMNLV